jgi:hypothetical protein
MSRGHCKAGSSQRSRHRNRHFREPETRSDGSARRGRAGGYGRELPARPGLRSTAITTAATECLRFSKVCGGRLGRPAHDIREKRKRRVSAGAKILGIVLPQEFGQFLPTLVIWLVGEKNLKLLQGTGSITLGRVDQGQSVSHLAERRRAR